MEKFIKTLVQEIFFKSQLTFMDFLIIGLGTSILVYQIYKRLTTWSGRFCKKAKKDPLLLSRTTVNMSYLASMIELLPILGLLGTVWGLRNALVVISNVPSPTIKQIATEIAPALSTTFFGLMYASLNLAIYNYLHAYFTELMDWCRQNIPEAKENK